MMLLLLLRQSHVLGVDMLLTEASGYAAQSSGSKIC